MIGGVMLLGRAEWVRKFSVHFVSFAAGTLLAAAFLDLLPEAIETGEGTDPRNIFWLTLLGIIIFFLIERLILRIHAHNPEDNSEHGHATPSLLLAGDAAHNFVDGVIIASAFIANPALGVTTAVAVAAHELPQEISDFSIMLHHGWAKNRVFWWNFGVSLTNVLGAVLAFVLRESILPVLPYVLAATAGIFIYIASSDLLPELSAKRHMDKSSHVIVLLALGIFSVWILGRLTH